MWCSSLLEGRGGMRVGDLVRYREMINHRTGEKTDWALGLLIKKEYNTCHILDRQGRHIRIWSSLVQKAGRKDATS